MINLDATPSLVIAVEPDPVTRRLFNLILHPLEFRLLTTDALDSGDFQQVLNEIEQPGSGDHPPSGLEKIWLFINGNLLAECDPPKLHRLQRFRGAGFIFAVLEPGIDARPVPANFPLDGTLAKPLKPAEVLAALLDKGETVATSRITAKAGRQVGADGILEGLNALIAEMEMDPSMINELTRSFILRGGEYLENLEEALTTWNEAELERISHTMKGMSANLRFTELTTLCGRVGQLTKGGHREAGTDIFQEVKSEYLRVCAAIEAKWPAPG